MAPQNASTEQQGVHDPYIIEADGKVYLYWSEAMSSSASIGAAIYDGTFEDLVTDLSAPTLTL